MTAPMMGVEIRVADQVWVALALLHREQPERVSFSAREIREKVQREATQLPIKNGVNAHIYQHCVANTPRSTAGHRMLYRLPDNTLRLYRPGDECHPDRKGKITPVRSELPSQYHYLLEWYQKEYCDSAGSGMMDPVLAMEGVGKDLWKDEDGDRFINRLREEWREGPVG